MTENVLNLNNLRLAVLIDAENVPQNCIKRVLEEIAIYGTPTIKRIYGDWTSHLVSGWKPLLLENAITPIQQYSYTQGKNSSDSAMIIDAMDIFYSGRTDGFVIVSSDSDFTRLAIRLREAGQRVIGIGEKKTPSAFIAACDKFTYIEVINERYAKNGGAAATASANKLQKDVNQTEKQPKKEVLSQKGKLGGTKAQDEARAQPQKLPDDIIELIAGSVADLTGDSGSVYLGELGSLIMKKKPNFDHRNFGYKTLSAMIISCDRFDVECRQNKGSNSKYFYVRDREA